MNPEQSVGAALGIIGFVVSALLSIVMGLLVYINKEQQEKHKTALRELKEAHEAKLKDQEKKTEEIDKRLHEDEKATIRIDGDLKLARNESAGLTDDIHDLKKGMVTKVEFETRMNNQDKLLGMVLQKIDGSRYSSQSTLPAVRSPQSESEAPRRR